MEDRRLNTARPISIVRPVRDAPARHPLVPALRERVSTLLGERLQRMFDGADDFLFEMSEKAQNNEQQRLFFDTMRAVRLERARIAQYFRSELSQAFSESDNAAETNARDDIDFSQLQLQEQDEVEEAIAVKNMGAKAETAYAQPLWELDLRMRWLAKHLPSVEVPRRALTPAGFCEAFRISVHALDIAFDVKLVIYKLFDRLVLGDLTPVYTELIELMTQHGVHAEKASTTRPVTPPPPPAAQVAAAASAAVAQQAATLQQPPAGQPPEMDPATLTALQAFGGLLDSAGLTAMQTAAANAAAAAGMPPIAYTDSMLASELLCAARGQAIQGLEPGRAWAMTQRAGLVGRMFNEILADSQLPPELARSLEALRFPVIKTALSDIEFFSRPDHPVRSLVNELAGMAAATRAGGTESVEAVSQLVRKVRTQFDRSAEQVRPEAHRASPLADGDIERFLDQQQAQGQTRRHAIIEKTRQVVAQELQLRTLSRPLAPEVQPLLRSGWAPMMAMRLLRSGSQSQDWQSGMDLLQRVLEALDPRRAKARSDDQRQTLRRDLELSLEAAGLPADRVQHLLKGLDLALEKLPPNTVEESARAAANEAEAPEPAQPELKPEQALEILLVPGCWFRVFDRGQRDTRWLKVVSHTPERQAVLFAEFDGRNHLTLHPRELLVDLVARRTEPIDPTPAARAALRKLREGREGREKG